MIAHRGGRDRQVGGNSADAFTALATAEAERLQCAGGCGAGPRQAVQERLVVLPQLASQHPPLGGFRPRHGI